MATARGERREEAVRKENETKEDGLAVSEYFDGPNRASSLSCVLLGQLYVPKF